MYSFRFTRTMWEAIQSAGLSDRDTMALIRTVMQHAFGGSGELPELKKIAQPMAFLLCALVDEAAESDPPVKNADPAPVPDA